MVEKLVRKIRDRRGIIPGEHYVVTENIKEHESAYLIGSIADGRIYLDKEKRTNSTGTYLAPNKKSVEKGIPVRGAVIITHAPTPDNKHDLRDEGRLIEGIVKEVVRKRESHVHYVTLQNHEVESAKQFLRENLYCY